VKRFPFLDWMRGLAVLIMIQCHVFNSFTRLDQRHASFYVLSQFVGGMAAPLFLFMAGMTSGFQMESLERREPNAIRRWMRALRRAAYIVLIAFLFRLTNFLGALPRLRFDDLLKVDILNAMGLAMAVFAAVALLQFRERFRVTLLASLAVAVIAPLVSGLDWSGISPALRYYIVPGPDRGQFPFFPCAAYVGFGLAAGFLVKRTAEERTDHLMRWAVLIGFTLILGAEYFTNLPYSVYSHSDFWRNSPGLVLIRVGVMLLMLAAAYLWTEFGARSEWNWVENLGKTSLLVYWVHVMLVYGDVAYPLKRALTVGEAGAAAVGVTMLMVALSELRLRRKARSLTRWKAATTVAGA
jgi:uncharacterized membrane protein